MTKDETWTVRRRVIDEVTGLLLHALESESVRCTMAELVLALNNVAVEHWHRQALQLHRKALQLQRERQGLSVAS